MLVRWLSFIFQFNIIEVDIDFSAITTPKRQFMFADPFHGPQASRKSCHALPHP